VLSDTDIGGEGDEGGVVLQPSQVPATTITTTLNDFHHESNNNHDHGDELTLSMTMSDCNKELEHEDDDLGDEHHAVAGDYRAVIESEEEAARSFERRDRGPLCNSTRGVALGLACLVMGSVAVLTVGFANQQVKGPAGIAVTAVLLIVFVLLLVVVATCLIFCGGVCLVAVSLHQRNSAREQLAESGVVVATW